LPSTAQAISCDAGAQISSTSATANRLMRSGAPTDAINTRNSAAATAYAVAEKKP